jgi:hypothetical protein
VALSAALLLIASARAQAPAADSAPDATTPGPRHGHGFGPGGGPFGDRMELLGFGGMRGGKVVTGAPFTAVANAESKRTLADGTVITQSAQSNLFRDAQGRFRREVTLQGIGSATGAPHSFVMIQDPVAGAGYMLQPDKKVAHILPQHTKGGPNADSATGPRHGEGNDANNPNFTKVSLGTQTINGVSAQGTRFTRTIPAGQMGNDKPLTITKEEWYSPDLQMMVQIKHSDPFVGDTTYIVSNIQRAAPNPSVFSVPSDYTVQEGPAHGPGGRWRGRGQHTPPAPDAASPSN